LLAYVFPYIKPENLGSFAGISLLTPILILINVIFLVYWVLKISRIALLSLIILAIGFPNLSRFYKLSGKKTLLTDDIKVMSYNVRMFNEYKWIDDDSIPSKINHLIDQKAPDILCFQEYAPNNKLSLDYTYKHIVFSKNNKQFGHAVFSKFPIISKGSLDFKNSGNNIIYTDLKIDDDTVRVYNIHLQSLKLNPKKENFGKKNAAKLRDRISTAFQKQQHQVEKFIAHQKSVNYPIIVVGDFNNTAYSWAYRSILKNRKDAYVVAGKGFDKTYDFTFPMRIDFIMVDKKVIINHYKSYRDKYSDHFPIVARIDRKSLLQ
jgi:endonuclease/exonuclease/phosphatase family metal-dependent hydrolase